MRGAAVGEQLAAADEAALVQVQEQRVVGDLLGPAHEADRRRGLHHRHEPPARLMSTRASHDIEAFIRSVVDSVGRVPGTAVFLSAAADGVPHAFRHNIKHNKVLHDRNVVVTVQFERVPLVEEAAHAEIADLGAGFSRIILRYGFMQRMDVPESLQRAEGCGVGLELEDVSFFLGRQTIIPAKLPGMALWRERLFARSAETPMEFLKLPPRRVIKLGSQLEIYLMTIAQLPRNDAMVPDPPLDRDPDCSRLDWCNSLSLSVLSVLRSIVVAEDGKGLAGAG